MIGNSTAPGLPVPGLTELAGHDPLHGSLYPADTRAAQRSSEPAPFPALAAAGVRYPKGQAVSTPRLSLPPRPLWTSYSTKFDGSLHWSWYGQIVYAGPDRTTHSETAEGDGSSLFPEAGRKIVLLHRAGAPVTTHSGQWLPETDSLTTFYSHLGFNLSYIFRPDGALSLVYCHLASPARIANGLISWIDLDLDLAVRPDGSYRLLDQEEFVANSRRWGYSAGLQARVWATAAELASEAENGTGPFNDLAGTLAEFVEKELAPAGCCGEGGRHD